MALQFTKTAAKPPTPILDPTLAASSTDGSLVLVAPKVRRPHFLESERILTLPWAMELKTYKSLVDRAIASPVVTWNDDDEDDDQPDEKPYPVTEDGIACISVRGPLVPKSYWFMTYSKLAELAEDAYADSSIKGVLFCYDSPGGEACSDWIETTDLLRSLAATKPTAAISKDQCYSAAYCLASTAPKLFVTSVGGTGSIGCWSAHVDLSEMYKEAGVKVTLIFAGKKKVDGNPFEPLSSGAEADMQDQCDRIQAIFVNAVAKSRGVSADDLYATEAGCYPAETGMPLLCDAVGTVDDALGYLRGQIATAALESNDQDPPDDEMMSAALGTGTILSVSYTDAEGVQHTQIVNSVHDLSNIQAGAIPPHKTATSDKSWDGPANEARLKSDQNAAYYRRAYAWQENGSDGTKKVQFKFPHHEVSESGSIGAANIKACQAGIGNLNGGRGGTTIPAADRKGVHAHLAKHLKDAGLEAPDLKSEAELALAFVDAASIADRLADALRADVFHADASQHMPTLIQYAFNKSGCGWADYEYPKASSEGLFGQPGVILAVRRFAGRSATAPENGRKVSLFVAPYGDSTSIDLGGFKERYERGAFSQGLNQDPRVLWGHDDKYVLGRQSSGTARFWDAVDGVHAEADLPETSYADDVLCLLRRNDVSASSASFWILKFRFETRDGERIRVVERALLRDASIVSFPAYADTEASVQSEQAALSNSMDFDAGRLAILRLR